MAQITGNIQVLEQGKPLSESLLFTLLTGYYQNRGPRAWDETPYYPTNNAFLADAYAELVVAFWRDLARAGKLMGGEPLTLIELASGAGALAVPLIAALERKRAHFAALRDREICYALTDIVEANIESWRADPQLASLEKQGRVRFARFAPETDSASPFEKSQVPPVILGNYYFDSIPHDYFQTERGTLQINRPTLYRELSADVGPDSPPAMEQLRIHDRFVDVSPEDVYPDPELGTILREYAESLPEHSFFFPIGALRALKNLRALLGGEFLLLASDKGQHRSALYAGHCPTPHTPHNGTASVMVNFDAIGRFLEGVGGRVWRGPENPPLTSLAAVTRSGDWENLSAAAETHLETVAPAQSVFDLATLLGTLDPEQPHGGFAPALSCVRLAAGDSWVFQTVAPRLLDGLETLDPGVRAELIRVLARVESALTPLSVGAFAAYGWLRCLYFHLKMPDACLSVSERARAAFGPHRDHFFYLGAISEARGDLQGARRSYAEALALDPTCAVSAAGLLRVSEKAA